MDKNKDVQLSCFAIAISSLGNCGDAIHLGFLRMQIVAIKCNYSNKKLATLYNNQKLISGFEYVMQYITKTKIEALQKENINKADFIICTPENMTKTH